MTALARRRRTPLGQTFIADPQFDPASSPARIETQWPLIARDGEFDDLRLFDLTAQSRFGLKGQGAGGWLQSKGLSVPDDVNMMTTTRGLDIVRLGADDFVLLDSSCRLSHALAALREDWDRDTQRPKGFNAWRDEVWAWFYMMGQQVSDLLARACPVDLHHDRFPRHGVAQTRVAHMDCTLVRSDRTNAVGFDLFFDVASSKYMFEALNDLIHHG